MSDARTNQPYGVIEDPLSKATVACVDDKRVQFLKIRLKRSGPVRNLTVGKGKAFPLQGLDSP
jgi:hypothetical protein